MTQIKHRITKQGAGSALSESVFISIKMSVWVATYLDNDEASHFFAVVDDFVFCILSVPAFYHYHLAKEILNISRRKWQLEEEAWRQQMAKLRNPNTNWRKSTLKHQWATLSFKSRSPGFSSSYSAWPALRTWLLSTTAWASLKNLRHI